MKFDLLYRGALPACTQNNTRRLEKQRIRLALHPQLEVLWRQSPVLRTNALARMRECDVVDGRLVGRQPPKGFDAGMRDASFPYVRINGIAYVPLVTRFKQLTCKLDMVFRRRDDPGGVIKGGDIDNRLKTLFDGLRIPHTAAETGDLSSVDPVYCLLEDDALISAVSIDTRTLLVPTDGDRSTDVDLAIHVHVEVTSSLTVNDGF